MAMKTTKHLLLAFLVLATIACGKKEMTSDSSAIQSSVIIGDIDWVETETLAASSFQARNARAVGKINLPWADSRCTAFLISEDVIMTNQHCIEQASHAQGVKVTFDLVEGVTADQRQEFDCSTFIGNDEELDFALLRCEGSPGAQYGTVKLARRAATAGSDLYVIHQNCDYYTEQECEPTKKLSNGKLVKIRTEDGEYAHNADTLGGSSGSPVFGANHEVIAIHHAGAGGWFNGRGYENYAVPMHAIVTRINTKFPSVLSGGTAPAPKPENPLMSKGSFYQGEVTAGETVKSFFEQKTASVVEVRVLLGDDAGDLDLYVYNKQGKLVGKSISTTKTELVKLQLPAGEYSVVVLGYKGATGSFKVQVKDL